MVSTRSTEQRSQQGIMADSHGNSAANTQEISVEAPRISALQQEGIASDSLVEYLKVNKSKFSWAGTFY